MFRKIVSVVLLLCMLVGVLPAVAEDQTQMFLSLDEVILAVGKTKKLSATVTPAAAKKAGVTMESSDTDVATVDKNGKIKAVGLGECQIVVTSNYDPSVSVSIPMYVVVPAKKVNVTADTKTIYIGETATLTPVITPDTATMPTVTYESSNEAVAVVDENGVVTGISKGRAAITVTSRDGYAKNRIQIQVLQQAESVTVTPEESNVFPGKKVKLKATVLPKSASSKKITWLSSDESIAKVNKSGAVTAVSLGTATITAVSEDGYAMGTALINVAQPVESVLFESKTASVLLGETLQLEPIVLPLSANNQTLTYKSSNKRIATVDENGVVTGLKGGKVTITATSADGSKKSAKITVTVVVPVQGVSFNRPATRVGVNGHTYVTATLSPKGATNKNMTWTIADTSIATVKGDTNKVRITGKRWGQTVLTGTTEDGDYTASIIVNVGNLRRAVTIESIKLDSNDRPVIVLKNRSNMTLKNIRIMVFAYDEFGDPAGICTQSEELNVVYYEDLYSGEKSNKNYFTMKHYNKYHDKIYDLKVAVIGWECEEGYMDNNGKTRYSYTIPDSSLDWQEIAIN